MDDIGIATLLAISEALGGINTAFIDLATAMRQPL